MGIQPRSNLMWCTKRSRLFVALLVVLVLTCIICEACLLIQSVMLNVNQRTVSARRGKYKPTDEAVVYEQTFPRFQSSYEQRYGIHDVESINLQMRQLYMKKPFLDSRLAPINFTIVPKASLCSDVDFVVVVHVRAEDAPSRNFWRNTYGNRDLKNQYNYGILFSIGKPSTLSDQGMIEEEAAECGDILQTDYKDTYRNLTLKHLAELRYLTMTCPRNVVVVKMDDDIALNVRNMFRFIKNNLTSEELYCPRFVTMEEWNKPMYPSYCWIWCYLAPLTAVERIISVAHSQRFFWIDDVFITGVLREAANVSIAEVRPHNDMYYYKGRQSVTRAA
ncbi:Hexosyltransferase [Trichostrongylus colubriformis]|uniref:Hexosyltransferase n=1 Tax=Trichostrongylus colubriformis TaxID=6319 RepID=A0AAN8ESS8_TRICO